MRRRLARATAVLFVTFLSVWAVLFGPGIDSIGSTDGSTSSLILGEPVEQSGAALERWLRILYVGSGIGLESGLVSLSLLSAEILVRRSRKSDEQSPEMRKALECKVAPLQEDADEADFTYGEVLARIAYIKSCAAACGERMVGVFLGRHRKRELHGALASLQDLVVPSVPEDQSPGLNRLNGTPHTNGKGRNMKDVIRVLVVWCMLAGSGPLEAATQYLLGIPAPDLMSQEDKQVVLNVLNPLLTKAVANDSIGIYDAATAREIARFTIGEGPVKLRSKQLAKPLQAIMKELNTPKTDKPSVRIDLSRFSREVVRPALRDDTSTRVLIFSGLFDACGGDVGASFSPGEVWSDGVLFASPKRTPFGGEGRAEEMKGALLYWVLLGESGTSPQREAAVEFYSKFAGVLGATLVEVLGSGQSGKVVERALNGDSKALVTTKPDPTDRRIVIRRVEDIVREEAPLGQALEKARAKVHPEALAVIAAMKVRDEIAYGQTIDLVILVDASKSWLDMQAVTHASVESAAQVIPDYSPRFRISVIPFREKELDRFKLTTIESQRADDGESHAKLGAYLATVKAEAAKVNIEGATIATLNELEKSPTPGRTVFCLITDQDTKEFSEKDGTARITDAVKSWTKGNDHRVVCVYVGDDPKSTQAAFMQSVAGAAGKSGFYVNGVDGLIKNILWAALRK